jgi:hypothetical protein
VEAWTLPGRIDSTLARGRKLAEARMTGRVNVRRLADIGAQDEETGLESGTWSIVLKGVPFRLNGGATEAVNIGGVRSEERLPISAPCGRSSRPSAATSRPRDASPSQR